MNSDKYFATLENGKFYHIFNKSVGNELLFRYEKDYFYFFDKLKRFVLPHVDLYAYCFLPNHFHLLVRIHEMADIDLVNQSISNFFNSYSKSYNKVYARTGKLFNLPYKRICIESMEHLIWLICYIHRNPVHHGLSYNFENFRYSSYKEIISGNEMLRFVEVIEWFGTMDRFIEFHKSNINFANSGKLLE